MIKNNTKEAEASTFFFFSIELPTHTSSHLSTPLWSLSSLSRQRDLFIITAVVIVIVIIITHIRTRTHTSSQTSSALLTSVFEEAEKCAISSFLIYQRKLSRAVLNIVLSFVFISVFFRPPRPSSLPSSSSFPTKLLI